MVTVDAENGAKVFQNEGKYPHRLPMLALAHYHQKTFGTTGIVSGLVRKQNDKLYECKYPHHNTGTDKELFIYYHYKFS